MKSRISRRFFAIAFMIVFLALIIKGAGYVTQEKSDDVCGSAAENAETADFTVCHGEGKNVSEKDTSGEDAAGELIFRETMPEGYSQICQTDYTCFVYEDGYYYYRSAADHMYLYRADEQGENRERLAKQIPKELYAVGDWIYFTNLSAGGTLYRVGRDGGEPEEVFPQQINRFIPLGETLYCLTEEGSLYSWRDDVGEELLYSGDIWWFNTDGTFLYLPVQSGEKTCTVALDVEGNVAARSDEWHAWMIPDRGNMFYLEYADHNCFIMCSSMENGKTEEISKVPCSEYEEIQDYVKEGNCFYFVCCEDGSGESKGESIFNIYQYDLLEDEWKQCYSKQITDWNFSLIYYPKAKNISIVNDSLFYKRPYVESDDTWIDGKGELWYKIGLGDWREELFEDMEPVQVGDPYFILHGEDEGRSVCQSDDCVYQVEKEDEEGRTIEADVVIPQFNDRVPAYEAINGHIRDDAESFYKRLLESAGDSEDAEQEPWDRFSGDWHYLYAYADDCYVSVLYWDCVSYEQYGDSNVKYKQYVTRLYSAETGEELEIKDLFTISEDELMLRFAYTVRKTFDGMRFLRDDFSMLGGDYPQRYYILTDTGIDVILVENLVTKEYHFEISYEELADILVRYGKGENFLQELEKILKSNLLEDITFQESERAIFYYRARMKQFFDGYVVLVYKETVEKDIVYVGPLGIEKETGNMYQLKDGEYVLVKTGVLKGFALPDIPQDEFWVEWEAGSDDEDYKLSEEVYTAVFDCLKENGVEHIKLMDMGIYTFLEKKYYWLKLFDENDVQIFTLQQYCIDMENGDLYEVRDDFGTTYMSLYYMGNVY